MIRVNSKETAPSILYAVEIWKLSIMTTMIFLPSPSGRGVGGEGFFCASPPSPRPSPRGRGRNIDHAVLSKVQCDFFKAQFSPDVGINA